MADTGKILTTEDFTRVGRAVSFVERTGETRQRLAQSRHGGIQDVREAKLTEDLDAAGAGAPEMDATTAQCKFLWPATDNVMPGDDLREDPTGDEFTVVNRDPNFSASSGDYLRIAFINGEWRPLTGGGEGTTSLTDSCECDNDSLVQGVPLGGSPTVCCTSHERFTLDLGDLGTFSLWHADAAGVMGMSDTWSTFHEDSALDNPLVIDCSEYSESPMEDEYDVVMTLTSGAATIELVSRNEGYENCDVICLEYTRNLPFECQGRNQFNRTDWSGFTLEIGTPPKCVCVVPGDPSSSSGGELACPCFSTPEDIPKFAIVNVSGASYVPDEDCFDIDCCDQSNGTFSIPLNVDGTGATFCEWRVTDGSSFNYEVRLESDNGINIFIDHACSVGGFPSDGVFVSVEDSVSCMDVQNAISSGMTLEFTGSTQICINQPDPAPICICEPGNGDDRCGATVDVTLEFTDTPPPPISSGRCTPCGS